MTTTRTTDTAAVAQLLCVLMECWWGQRYSWTQSVEDYFRFDIFAEATV